MAIPYLILTDEDSNTYNLSPNFAIVDINTNATINVLNAAYAAGGENIADGFPEPKMIAVEGSISESTLAGMETAERAFKQACRKGGQLSLYTDTVSRYLEVEFAGLSETYERTLTHVDQLNKKYSEKIRDNAFRMLLRKYQWSSIANKTKNFYQGILDEYVKGQWKPTL